MPKGQSRGSYPAEFLNAKNSKRSEGSKKKTGYSSSQQKAARDLLDSNMSTDSEVSRQARLKGQDEVSPSGPKSRKDFKFFKHTTKGK